MLCLLFQVICVTTGTKCLNGEHINNRGMAVNDCHAEVLARRALRHFLLWQLDCALNGVPETIYNQVYLYHYLLSVLLLKICS